MPAPPDAIALALRNVLVDARKRAGLTKEELAAAAGVDRTYIGRLEAGLRQPTIGVLIAIANAVGSTPSILLQEIEKRADGSDDAHLVASRIADKQFVETTSGLTGTTGLTATMIVNAISETYATLDSLDRELLKMGAPPFSRLVELANLSSMIGNIVGAAIARESGGLYERSGPHKYQDLRSTSNDLHVEIKTALESNKPKGHLAKAGHYLTFRYVLCDASGKFHVGKENRGEVAYIWEVRFGWLDIDDFSISNTDGDSGKTAVVTTDALLGMERVYFDPDRFPYKRKSGPWWD